MASISLCMDDKEECLIKEYPKAKNLSVNTLLRLAVTEKIEDDIDLGFYFKVMQEHQDHTEAISFEEMVNELDIES